MKPTLLKTHYCFIPVEDGVRLESALYLCEAEPETLALIMHPHPLHEGNMNNKVVTTLQRVYLDCGISTVRFNSRGTMRSQGVFDNGNAEAQDIARVLNYLKAQLPSLKYVHLCGFSFGSFVVAVSAQDLAAQTSLHLSSITLTAPPIEMPAHPYFMPYPRTFTGNYPIHLIASTTDEIVAPASMLSYIDALKNKYPTRVKALIFENTSHFFHGKLIELKTQLTPLIHTLTR